MSRRSPARQIVLALCLLGAFACSGAEQPPNGGAATEAKPGVAAAPSASAPGEIPLRRPSRIEAKLVPPGAAIGADPDPRAPGLVFQAREAPAHLLGWLRATANGADFVLESELQEGAEHVLSGRVRDTGEAYTVRIASGAGGGTTGVVMVTAR